MVGRERGDVRYGIRPMIKGLDPRKDNERVIKFNLILLPRTGTSFMWPFMPYEQILKLRLDSDQVMSIIRRPRRSSALYRRNFDVRLQIPLVKKGYQRRSTVASTTMNLPGDNGCYFRRDTPVKYI